MPTYFDDQIFVSPSNWEVAGFPRGTSYPWSVALRIFTTNDDDRNVRGLYHQGLGIFLDRNDIENLSGVPVAIQIPQCPKCGSRTKPIPGYRTFRFGCPKYPDCRCWISPSFELLIMHTDIRLHSGIRHELEHLLSEMVDDL